MTIEEAAERYARVTDPEAHGIDFIREVFIAGAEWNNEQMMKEMVEGKIIFLLNGDVAINIGDTEEYNLGDKVCIIIVKEDK